LSKKEVKRAENEALTTYLHNDTLFYLCFVSNLPIKINEMDVLKRLCRKDKWFLGGGKGAIFAPPFPRWLTTPGFWDESFIADVKLNRLFCLIFFDSKGKPVRFQSEIKEWRPDRLVIKHKHDKWTLVEKRCVLPNHAWVSRIEKTSGEGPIGVAMVSLQDVREPGYGAPWTSLTACSIKDRSIAFDIQTRWPEDLTPDRSATEKENLQAITDSMRPAVTVHLEVGASATRTGATVVHAQSHDDSPLYETSILPEKLSSGKLRGGFGFQPGVNGMLHLAQSYWIEHEPVQFVCSAGLTAQEASQNLAKALDSDAIAQSKEAWTAYFASVPNFSCSDPFLTSAYWYRWYGLRLNTVDMPDLPGLAHPFVTEGVGFFRNFVTYSAQAHLREACWMQRPELALGILDNLEYCQRNDGSYPGHNYSGRPARDFYHADFGSAAVQLERIHPDSITKEHLRSLRRYAGYFEEVRSTRHSSGTVYNVFDQNETGQEYMSRYLFARPDADEWTSFSVGGVDATSYIAELFASLTALGEDGYRQPLDDALNGLASLCWDSKSSFFCDVSSKGDRSPARPATGFYPFRLSCLEELVSRIPNSEQSVKEWLLNPAQFWLNRGVPATAKSDETYCAEAEWKGKRLNCPWNGRSWPMTNSHVVDAMANVARRLDPGLREKAAETVMKAIRLMFHDGDPLRPSSYEHYNPETGVAALYRGYDDYMHSWIVDLVMRHVVGVQPVQGAKPEIDPLPLGLSEMTCSGIPSPSGLINVTIRNGKTKKESA
jgi:hypothetical protein